MLHRRFDIPIQQKLKTCNCLALVMLKPCVRVNVWGYVRGDKVRSASCRFQGIFSASRKKKRFCFVKCYGNYNIP